MATCQSVIMGAYKIGLLTVDGIRTHKKKITCKKLGQYRDCLTTNTIFNNLAPLQFCGWQNKEILMHKHLNLSGL